MPTDPTEKITELATSLAEDKGLILVEVELKPSGKETVVWVYMDAEDRFLNLDEYAEMSNDLAFQIDAHELFDGKYRLNVSSPGLSKPLVDVRQYPKNKGKKARVKYKQDEYHTAEGILSEVEEEAIVIEVKENDRLRIPFADIVETKILPVF
jgi:ribosome maturation factor RimP